MSWQSTSQIRDTLAMAKECAAKLLDQMIKSGYVDDADRTNWVSLTAACQRHVRDFNQAITKASHEPQTPPPDPQNH